MTSYQTQDVTFMSAPKRLVLLYSHILANLRKAGRAIELQDHPGQSQTLCKAREIVDELVFSLDREVGGALGSNLLNLYEYFQHEITQLDLHPDLGRLARLTDLVTILHGAWEAAAEQVAEQPVPAAVNE